MKSPVSLLTVMVFVTLLSPMLRSEPALAADGCPAPRFAAPVVYSASGKSYSVMAGDFNGDGKPDLVVANSSSGGYGSGGVSVPGSVSVLLGSGDGTFQPASNYNAGVEPYAVAVGDFNGDGKLDLATANWGDTNGSVSVLLGNGDGTFQPASKHNTGASPYAVAVGDFNGDGKLDLVVANSRSANISVLIGNGDGTFQPAVNYMAGWSPYSVAVGDFNGDDKLDVVVANYGSANVSVLLGNGDSTFRPAVNYSMGSYPASVAVGDFNGDRKPDLVVVTRGSISVLLGMGDGTFQSPISSQAEVSDISLAVGDVNGDGKFDLVLPASANSVSVLLGNGDGTFQTPVGFAAGAGIRPWSVVVGDFNGDGKSDLAVTSATVDFPYPGQYGISVLLNTCVPSAVLLNVTRGNSTVILAWPLPYTNFVLESTTSLGSTNWQGVSGLPTTNNGRCEVTVPLDPRQRYFRLRKT